MVRIFNPFACLRAAHAWIMLGVLAPLGMLAVSGLMLLDLRKDAYEKADQATCSKS